MLSKIQQRKAVNVMNDIKREKVTLSDNEKRIIEAYRMSSPAIKTMISQVLNVKSGEGRIVNGVFYQNIRGQRALAKEGLIP